MARIPFKSEYRPQIESGEYKVVTDCGEPVEIWKPILGYEDSYEISNFGNVRSIPHIVKSRNGNLYPVKGTNIKIFAQPNGYKFACLWRNNVCERIAIHKLVARAFIPNPCGLKYINHKDENRTNNLVFIDSTGNICPEKSNLEWCTQKYNCNYGTRNLKISQKLRNGRSSKPVLQYSKEQEFIREYPSASEAARSFNVHNGDIVKCCNGKKQSAYGYIWRYK